MKFTEVLDQLNIEYVTEGHRHVRPGWIGLDCPFCAKDTKKWHLGYSIEDHYTKCWRCGYHSAIDVIMEYTELSFKECKKLLDGIEVAYTPKEEKPKGNLILPKHIDKLQRSHIRYLKRRGFNVPELIVLWNIKGIGLASKLAWRIFIPIIYRGKVVSWTTRSISKDKNTLRYVSAAPTEESIPHKDLLYGQDFARDTILINEGPTDAWRIGPGAVATLGVNYSKEQLQKMLLFKKRIVCFDTEKMAQIRADKLCDDLSAFPGETFNLQLDAKDAASASDKEIRQIRKEFLR
jgi:DNA primase